MKPPPSSLLPLLLTLSLACLPLACSQPPPEETTPPAPVEAIAPQALVWGEWTELDGTTQPLPQHAARVSAAVEGRVDSVLTGADGKPVHEGQVVHAGDVIARLDTRIIEANRAKLEASRKDLEESRKQADYAVQLAEIELRRLEDLMSRRGASRGGTEDLPLVSGVQLETARVNLKDAESRQRAAAARLDAAAKELKGLEAQLALYTLRAPIIGRLGLVQVMPGQALTFGTPVAEVIDLDEVDALCYVPPHTAARLALDQPARLVSVKADGREDVSPADGKVVFIAAQAQAETGNFPVKVRFPNKNLRVRGNAMVRVQVETQPEKERLTIPESALMEDQDPPVVVVAEKVMTKNKEGKEEEGLVARQLQATVGARERQWQRVELLGLRDPEKKEKVPLEDLLVVTKGGHGLRTGDPVRIAEEEGDEK
jgi:multidrug efflux pump subunit AcrA (membrane-fusion protein)